MTACTAALLTPRAPGAIAVVQMQGDVGPVLAGLCGGSDARWPVGTVTWTRFGDIDDGVVLRPTRACAQLTPHGGLRVVEHLLEALAALGVQLVRGADLEPVEAYPEAGTEAEARRLALLARVESPLAVERLLAEPDAPLPPALLTPALVVAVGPPDVGKSTLMNALLGREAAITAAGAGTTRDAVVARLDCGGIVVDWVDTPGIRETSDDIEREAIRRGREIAKRAAVLVSVTDHSAPWAEVGRAPDVWVQTKRDLGERRDRPAGMLGVCALTGAGMSELVAGLGARVLGA